jgi:2-C-methyl-D-erythritol 4-phosphate cytidylyltransferase
MGDLGGTADDVAVIIPAAGAGERLGAGAPKALVPLAGDPLLSHAARRAGSAARVGCLVVAAPPGAEELVRDVLSSALRQVADHLTFVVVPGGVDRQRSVRAALAALPGGYDIVLVHDAARALAPASLVDEVAGAVRAGHDAVIPVLPVADTVTEVDLDSGASLGNLERSRLRVVQTPQGFRRSVLAEAHRLAGNATATDDAGLVARAGVIVHTIPGSARAFKITTPFDLTIAAALLAAAPG